MDVGSVSGVSAGSGAGTMSESAPVGAGPETSNNTLNTPVVDAESESGKDGRGVCSPSGTDHMETNMSSEDIVSLGQNKGTSSTDDIGWRFDMSGVDGGGEGKELIDQIMKIMEIMLALKLIEETMKQVSDSGGMGSEEGSTAAGGASSAGGDNGKSGGSGAGAATGGAL